MGGLATEGGVCGILEARLGLVPNSLLVQFLLSIMFIQPDDIQSQTPFHSQHDPVIAVKLAKEAFSASVENINSCP